METACRRNDDQRLAELEDKLKQVTSDNERLRLDNIRLQDMINELQRSLTEAKNRATTAEQQLQLATAQATGVSTASGLPEELSRINKQLSETRKQLSDVQERLAVAEQVTAATQQRALQEEGIYERLIAEDPEDHIYQKLLNDFTQLTTHIAGPGILRALYTELTTKLDARVVAAGMYQRNALTLKEFESIHTLRDHPIEAAEKLLNIVMEQPDAVYLCFLDALKHSEQPYIYHRLVEDGCKDL